MNQRSLFLVITLLAFHHTWIHTMDHNQSSSTELTPTKTITKDDLFIAAQAGKLEIIKEWHNQKGSLSIVNQDGMQLIHVAALHGHVAVIEWLVRHGVDIAVRETGSFDPINADDEHHNLTEHTRPSQLEQPDLKAALSLPTSFIP